MSGRHKDINVIVLIGQTISALDNTSEEINFATVEGKRYRMYHDQDCCESVTVESIKGELTDLIGVRVVSVNEEISADKPADAPRPECEDSSATWTTFTIVTEKGTVVIRWYGTSNGYYSESVSFVELTA